jgi:hypothetical protein
MRSLIQAVYIFAGAIGSAVAQALVPLFEGPYLVCNYSVVGGFCVIASVGAL